MIIMWKFWKRVPTYEEMNAYCGKQLPEEDPAAALQNADEVEFNKSNPIYDKRIEKAKKNVILRMSEDKKMDLLWKLHINESMEEQFDNINKQDEK